MQSFLKKYYNQGLEKGVQQGIQQGVQQGELLLLSRQLRKRFGDLPEWAEQMLKEAYGAMLEVWSERILIAVTLLRMSLPSSGSGKRKSHYVAQCFVLSSVMPVQKKQLSKSVLMVKFYLLNLLNILSFGARLLS
ncbi:MAG: hypothetical protein Q3M30_15140 [Candidatus Electrothrix sp. Rat3]|nr:hypothetical protein [Candidatus Electrothrix rattekaaiensis]